MACSSLLITAAINYSRIDFSAANVSDYYKQTAGVEQWCLACRTTTLNRHDEAAALV